jgi:hypothetical protein
MMSGAGFRDIRTTDVTDRFRATQAAWMAQVDAHEAQLVALEGSQSVQVRRGEQRQSLAAIDDGLLRRAIFSGVRP